MLLHTDKPESRFITSTCQSQTSDTGIYINTDLLGTGGGNKSNIFHIQSMSVA